MSREIKFHQHIITQWWVDWTIEYMSVSPLLLPCVLILTESVMMLCISRYHPIDWARRTGKWCQTTQMYGAFNVTAVHRSDWLQLPHRILCMDLTDYMSSWRNRSYEVGLQDNNVGGYINIKFYGPIPLQVMATYHNTKYGVIPLLVGVLACPYIGDEGSITCWHPYWSLVWYHLNIDQWCSPSDA